MVSNIDLTGLDEVVKAVEPQGISFATLAGSVGKMDVYRKPKRKTNS